MGHHMALKVSWNAVRNWPIVAVLNFYVGVQILDLHLRLQFCLLFPINKSGLRQSLVRLLHVARRTVLLTYVCRRLHLIVCDRSSPWARSVLQWGCRQHAHIALFAALRWLGLRGLGVLFLTLKRVHTQPFPRIPGRGRSQKVAASIFVIIRGSSGGSRVCALGRRARDIAHRAPPGPARHLCRVPWLHVADIVVEYTRDVRHLFNRVYSPGGSFCDHKGRFVVRFVRGTIIGLHGCSGGASLGSRGPRQAAHALHAVTTPPRVSHAVTHRLPSLPRHNVLHLLLQSPDLRTNSPEEELFAHVREGVVDDVELLHGDSAPHHAWAGGHVHVAVAQHRDLVPAAVQERAASHACS
mmetsp:Transcript_13383/g.25692  ORF Transcript_13383/g.25692 Transcript_13383/m.25692 type:complete len:354 (-) Transcript_13383:1196-2257(-)